MNHLMNLIHLNNTQELLGQTWHKIEVKYTLVRLLASFSI